MHGPPSTSAPPWLDRACVIVPAYDAERTVASVVRELRSTIPELSEHVFVVDDGSRDATAREARSAGATVVAHGKNRGKGAALHTGLATAAAAGHEVAVTVDADGQHPATEARRLLYADADAAALVLGVRALARAGAPRKNQVSNEISNFFISRFAGTRLSDTQCGLRRYPVARTLALSAHGEGYDFEAEILLRAVWAGVRVIESPIEVLYPEDRTTHFHAVRDPARIVRTVVRALRERG